MENRDCRSTKNSLMCSYWLLKKCSLKGSRKTDLSIQKSSSSVKNNNISDKNQQGRYLTWSGKITLPSIVQHVAWGKVLKAKNYLETKYLVKGQDLELVRGRRRLLL